LFLDELTQFVMQKNIVRFFAQEKPRFSLCSSVFSAGFVRQNKKCRKIRASAFF
jgi:hypothetical protein